MNNRKLGIAGGAGVLVALAVAGVVLWRLRSPGASGAGQAGVEAAEAAPGEKLAAAETAGAPPGPMPQPFVESLGIEITALQVGVNGSRINLRYRVLDPERAARLFQPSQRAYLLDASNRNIARPNSPIAEPLRGESGQTLRAGRIYTYFFANPGAAVRPGDTVTLVIGDTRAEGLVVR